MRTDSNTLLPIASASTAKKSSMVRAPEKQGAAFSEDFNRAKDVISSNKRDDKPRVVSTDEPRQSSAISDKSSHPSTKDDSINPSEKESTVASKTVPSPVQSKADETHSVHSKSDNAEAEKGAQSVVSNSNQVDESGKKLQLSGEASPESSDLANGDKAMLLGGQVVTASAAVEALQKSPELNQKMTLSNDGEVASEVGASKTELLETDVSLDDVVVGDEHALANSVPRQQGLMDAGQVEGSLLDPSSVVQPSDVQSLPGISASAHQELGQAAIQVDGLPIEGLPSGQVGGVSIEGLPSGQVDAVPNSLVNGQVAEASKLDGIDLKKVNETGVIAMAPVAAAVATGVNQAVTQGQEVAGSDEELSWVLDQMSSTPRKTSTDGVVTGLLAEAPEVELVKSASLAGAGAGLALGVTGKLNADSTGGSATDLLQGAELTTDDVIGNEPIELRKKEHEAMLGRMAGNVDAKLDEVGGLSSSFNQQMGRAAASLGVAGQVVSANQPLNMAMNVPPGHPNWAAEMGQKVAWVAREGGHTARIRLDPPELGSLTVKVSVDSDSNTQINFVAATTQARDLLEGQMGRLRDMLAQQGIDLSRAEVDVSQQDTSGTQRDARQTGVVNNSDASVEEETDDVMPGVMSYVSATGVDFYA
ncbi:flagellar hook-length control protein FliK [Marinomonas posidonica]|uniref:Flagellar hook-length control protein n=1 Tax=Marinomonas posidonica (strain CECT 7376 / NCIMB 14433 / IVIA-Po-181) TaxID=491952 RepID=F6CS81_MARPP|nr:flagellar hook-length control protein FliK [Marinomonas posidonica]AEF53868.1 flagellar hook-length control protein [Marinomonas posidonica IVIA-Po-181]